MGSTQTSAAALSLVRRAQNEKRLILAGNPYANIFTIFPCSLGEFDNNGRIHVFGSCNGRFCEPFWNACIHFSWMPVLCSWPRTGFFSAEHLRPLLRFQRSIRNRCFVYLPRRARVCHATLYQEAIVCPRGGQRGTRTRDHDSWPHVTSFRRCL